MNYNVAQIQNEFLPLTGFIQPVNPSFPKLSPDLTTALSGIIINDGAIPFVTPEVLYAFCDNFATYDFSEWSISINYPAKFRVKYTYPTYSTIYSYSTGERTIYTQVS